MSHHKTLEHIIVVAVNPHYTSQKCSDCGTIAGVPKIALQMLW
ncbi:zinc ribbon domain-containing protein [Chrysosporum bergii]